MLLYYWYQETRDGNMTLRKNHVQKYVTSYKLLGNDALSMPNLWHFLYSGHSCTYHRHNQAATGKQAAPQDSPRCQQQEYVSAQALGENHRDPLPLDWSFSPSSESSPPSHTNKFKVAPNGHIYALVHTPRTSLAPRLTQPRTALEPAPTPLLQVKQYGERERERKIPKSCEWSATNQAKCNQTILTFH